MFALNYRDARPIYAQICDGMRQQILSGILQKGERLPSVRELAGMLTINPNTIQRSYRQLEMEGWIASVPGKGSFVCGIPSGLEQDRQQLFEELDRLCARMQQLGISTEHIINRLKQGGNQDA